MNVRTIAVGDEINVKEDVFLMCASVMLAKECLEDIEEVGDNKDYVERMLEAHKHLTEAVETYNSIIVNNNH